MGMFDNLSLDPDLMGQLSTLGNNLTGPTRIPMPLSYGVLKGLTSVPQGVQASNQLQQQGQQTQMGALNLQKAQAMQPAMLGMIKNGFGSPAGGASGTPGNGSSPADQQFQQAYSLAMMSGDMGKASQVLQSWAEHNPSLAGAIETQKANAGITKDANGNIVRAGSALGGNQNPAGAFNPPPPAIVNGQPQAPANMDDLLNSQTQAASPASAAPQAPPVMAADGKPILSGQNNLFPSDPTGTPKFNIKPQANTDTGVDEAKTNLKNASDSAYKAYDAWANNRNSLTKEGAIIDSVTKALANVQPGTTMAQFPDAVNRLAGAGLLSKDSAANLSDVQAVRTFLMKDAILQLRDQNANLEGNPSRIMQSEMTANLEHGLNVELQPEALWKVLTQAGGMVDYNKAMIDDYNAKGGLGNRMANGYTMTPNAFAQGWQPQHNTSDWIKQRENVTAPFKGMAGNTTPQYTKGQTATGPSNHKIMYDGTQWVDQQTGKPL